MDWKVDVYQKNNNELYDAWDTYHLDIVVKMKWQCHYYAANWIHTNVKLGSVIADVGCGNGQVGIALGHHEYILEGYDVNQAQLDRFKADNYSSVTQLDMNTSPLPTTCSTIVIIGAIAPHHIDGRGAKHIADSLATDGVVLATFPDTSKFDNWFQEAGWAEQPYLVFEQLEKIVGMTDEDGKVYYQNIVVGRTVV